VVEDVLQARRPAASVVAVMQAMKTADYDEYRVGLSER
jgi:hypothetical protein